MPTTTPQLAHEVWNRLAGSDFAPAELRPVEVNGYTFQRLYLPRREEFSPELHLTAGADLFLRPRFAAYRHRFILVTGDNLRGAARYSPNLTDIAGWMSWAAEARHVVTMSTLKSGASVPLAIHAQSFPLTPAAADHGPGVQLTALVEPRVETLVDYDTMPHFHQLSISRLIGYPAPGYQLRPRDAGPAALDQVARKTFEFALNYDHLKSFNLVIVPEDGLPLVYFFPRRRDGRATWGTDRWQIAALELNGLLQAKRPDMLDELTPALIGEIFQRVTPTDRDLASAAELLQTF